MYALGDYESGTDYLDDIPLSTADDSLFAEIYSLLIRQGELGVAAVNLAPAQWDTILELASKEVSTAVFAQALVSARDGEDYILPAEEWGEEKRGPTETTGVGFGLMQNAPNPYRGHTTIAFSIPASQSAVLIISDLVGRPIRVIPLSGSGYESISGLSSGVYVYSLSGSSFSPTFKMIAQ